MIRHVMIPQTIYVGHRRRLTRWHARTAMGERASFKGISVPSSDMKCLTYSDCMLKSEASAGTKDELE